MKLIIEVEPDIYEDCKRLGCMGSITAQIIANGIPYDDQEQEDAFWRRLYGTGSEVKNE